MTNCINMIMHIITVCHIICDLAADVMVREAEGRYYTELVGKPRGMNPVEWEGGKYILINIVIVPHAAI